ncbi:hypothetical protein SARI_02261 [Salmonella enterica subsp. arizonae serovar 62:z4,z23:-]|uniref:Uncharacterized protein n=1 Tax=Salmonella arizonae (strain ATCC BAA-731 / CDC346-86 / RSK2980) TaxID=41514 RepID=A9MKB3_SALAR|nr:hypothetical protein SARI_02261 [Salmonella enterica subsp. arizonae serovar 62:z4,z23:-]
MLFLSIINRYCIFSFLVGKTLAPSPGLRHFLLQANTKSMTQQITGEGYVFYFRHIRY